MDSETRRAASLRNPTFRYALKFKGRNLLGYLTKEDEHTAIAHTHGVIQQIEGILKYPTAITSDLQWKDYLNKTRT